LERCLFAPNVWRRGEDGWFCTALAPGVAAAVLVAGAPAAFDCAVLGVALPPPAGAVVPPGVAEGAAFTGPDCTVPAEPVALLPPPIWAVPVELEAELVPLPPTVAGVDTV
jgi:hypothetical protein